MGIFPPTPGNPELEDLSVAVCGEVKPSAAVHDDSIQHQQPAETVPCEDPAGSTPTTTNPAPPHCQRPAEQQQQPPQPEWECLKCNFINTAESPADIESSLSGAVCEHC